MGLTKVFSRKYRQIIKKYLFPLTPVRKGKWLKGNKCRQVCGKGNPSHTVCGNATWCSHYGVTVSFMGVFCFLLFVIFKMLLYRSGEFGTE